MSRWRYSPILEPDLHLTRAESRNLARESLPLGRVRMCLPGKLAHEESSLVVGEALKGVSFMELNACEEDLSLPEAFHLPLVSPPFGGSLLGRGTVSFRLIPTDILIIVNG